jgi:probable phosphoglycerate mutase
MNIITIQHTQSIHHINGMIGSQTDWDLTALGIEQAHRIGRKLKDEIGDDKYVIYSSDLKRCKQGAEIVASYLGAPIFYDDRLRELNLGSGCGKSVAWFNKHKLCDDKTCDSKMLPDAESRREAWFRLKPFYEMIEKLEHENVIIYSHGGLLAIWNIMHLGMKPEDLNHCSMQGKSGGVSFMAIDHCGCHSINRMSDMWYVK